MLREKKFKPIYLQVMDMMKKAIITGDLKPGVKLPPEKDYCKEFNISLLTLRRAFGILEKQGLLVRKKGAGTFIAPKASYNNFLKADLAVIIPTISTNGEFDIARLISASSEVSYLIGELARQKMTLRLTPYFTDKQSPEEIAEEEGVDGFIICSAVQCFELVELLATNKIPHICLESAPFVKGVNVAMNADQQATANCVKMLYTQGCKRLAYLGGKLRSRKVPTGYRRRLEGFIDSCRDLGLEVNDTWIVVDENHDLDIKVEITQLLTLPTKARPDGIVCAVKKIAVELLAIAAKLKIKIPDDIAVTCVDISDITGKKPLAQVTGFSKNRRKTGVTGANMLLEWIRNPNYKPHIEQLPLQQNQGITLLREINHEKTSKNLLQKQVPFY